MSSTKQEDVQDQSSVKPGKHATRLVEGQKEGKADSAPIQTSTRSPERKPEPEPSPTQKEEEEEQSLRELKNQKADRIAKKKTTDGARRSKRLSQQQRAAKEVEEELGEAEDEAWDQPVYKAPSRRGKR